MVIVENIIYWHRHYRKQQHYFNTKLLSLLQQFRREIILLSNTDYIIKYPARHYYHYKYSKFVVLIISFLSMLRSSKHESHGK